jgi:hypothetical protein
MRERSNLFEHVAELGLPSPCGEASRILKTRGNSGFRLFVSFGTMFGRPWFDRLPPHLALLGAISLSGCAATETPPLELVDQLLEEMRDQPGPIYFFAAQADLDQDERPEWIVHVVGPAVCGTGGCDTLVFATTPYELRLVARITVSRPPIVVAETSTHGWRDLIVRASGGGLLPGHYARLRYDGRTYVPNPTADPAESLLNSPDGRIAIPAFESFTEGQRLTVGRDDL